MAIPILVDARSSRYRARAKMKPKEELPPRCCEAADARREQAYSDVEFEIAIPFVTGDFTCPSCKAVIKGHKVFKIVGPFNHPFLMQGIGCLSVMDVEVDEGVIQ